MVDLPLLIERTGQPVAIEEYVSANLGLLEEGLATHGAVLMRGFEVASAEAFEQAVRRACPSAFDYRGGGSPRSQVSGTVYTSTEYASSQHIPLHVEGSYFPVQPERIWFCCRQPASEGGNTPLGDMRKVLATMEADLRALFEDKELIYVSNLSDGAGFGKSWQQAYGTGDRGAVERYLHDRGYVHAWRPDGGLHVETRAPAVRAHSRSGARYWCNQVVNWHWAANDEKTQTALKRVYGETPNHPKGVLFADRSEIPAEAVTRLRDHLRANEVVFDWHRNDVLVLDNEWISHGRQPYSDPDRRILVALS